MRASPVLPLLAALTAPGFAQVQNPADKQRPPEQEAPTRDLASEAPAIVVTDQASLRLREAELIGDNKQPRRTSHRNFPTTRISVRPPGEVDLEYWARVKVPRRLQLDLYAVANHTSSDRPLGFDEQKTEIRYAFADWGELWGNPTVYFEWNARSLEADILEYKLLLGDEITSGWYWGANFVLEHETGGARENVYEWTGGLSHTLVDSQFSLGGEVKAALVDDKFDRGDYARELEIGPSLQWRPTPRIHLDFAPLVGIGGDSRAWDIYFVLGVEI